VDLRAIELDVASQESADSAIEKIVAQSGGLDLVIHNAGHMVFGPAEAFTNSSRNCTTSTCSARSAQPFRIAPATKARPRLPVWISSSSVAGGTPPYLAPYFAAKASMDALAVEYARELALWGIQTSIMVPGAFTSPR
jgi:NAD(P)-dependent dehydrogenase (short-subunit alcohol dehydrogenase family)